MADEVGVVSQALRNFSGEEPDRTAMLATGVRKGAKAVGVRIGEHKAGLGRKSAHFWRHLEPPSPALDTCWGVFGFYREDCCRRVNSPWLSALISQCANEHSVHRGGDARACYLVFVEWVCWARWRRCQLEARMPL